MPITKPTNFVHTKDAAKVRELYVTGQLPYVTAHAQLRVFFGMGDYQADQFLAVTPKKEG